MASEPSRQNYRSRESSTASSYCPPFYRAPTPPEQPALKLDTCCAKEQPSIPRGIVLPSPISVYQHIRSSLPESPPYSESSYLTHHNAHGITSPLGSPPEIRRTARAFSLPTSAHPCLGQGGCVCTRHHHRNSPVAIKFGRTYEDPFYDEDDDSFEASGGSGMRRNSVDALRRPPSPIAERILKGDFNFD
jgi:hypothetical protein